MTGAFDLEVGPDRVATLTFDHPEKKVNLFTRPVFAELERVVEELGGRDDIGCLVLWSGKPGTFIAGADLEEIAAVGDPLAAEAASRAGQRIFATWESLPFPTVAAVRGTCVGGGTELALASSYILVSDRPELRIGLPEVRLGILPGWGGCTRLPRRIGIAPALDLILAGKTIPGRQALRTGLADALLPDAAFGHLVRDFARGHRDRPRRRRGRPELKELLLERNPVGRRILFDQARKKTLEQTRGHYPAPLRALEVIRVGVAEGRQAGFDAEARAIADLAVSPVAKNLIHLFRLMEAAKKDGRDGAGAIREVYQVGVLGAGLMGGGIAQLIAATAGIPVRLKEVGLEPLASGLGHAAALFDKQVRRRRLSEPEARRRMALIRPTLDYSGFGAADLVIEAVVEKLAVKQEVFAEVAARVPGRAVLSSNTSSLPIGEIGQHLDDPGRLVGMHFFNPVHKMPLVEIVVGPRTSAVAGRTAAAFARRLGKTPIEVKDSPGFLVNRLLTFYMMEAHWLLLEGHPIEIIDRAMTDWGMPMGPLTLTDEVGIEVAAKVAAIMGAAFPDRLPIPPGLERLEASGRRGAKAGAGFYRYRDGERAGADPEIYAILGVHPGVEDPDLAELADRMVLPLVNEAARCLSEEVVASAGELDLAMILGTGFPPFRGGPCRWADRQGVGELASDLERLAERHGDRFRPSPALAEAAAAGGFYLRWGGGTG